MRNRANFKLIVGYVDRLNRDVGQLAVLIEKLMKERGFVSLPSARNRVCWFTSHNYDQAWGWRIPHVARFFMREGATKVDSSLFYLILLETESAFDFPPVICGRVTHPAMGEQEIYGQVFDTRRIKSLACEEPEWRCSPGEKGWSSAEPGFASPTKRILGYIVNLFDISTPQEVADNIVTPLTQGDVLADLNSVMSVPRYAFGGAVKPLADQASAAGGKSR